MIRLRSTGELLQEGDFRRLHSSVGFPLELTQADIEPYEADFVHEVTLPTIGELEKLNLAGAVQGNDGLWYYNWEVVPLFEDIVREDGTVLARAEQEAALLDTQNNCQLAAEHQ
jgi:hypothetical protein